MVETRRSSAAPVPTGKRPPPSAASIPGKKLPPPSAASIGGKKRSPPSVASIRGKKRPKVRSFPTPPPVHAADPATGAFASSPERISTTPRGRGTAERELPRNLRAQNPKTTSTDASSIAVASILASLSVPENNLAVPLMASNVKNLQQGRDIPSLPSGCDAPGSCSPDNGTNCCIGKEYAKFDLGKKVFKVCKDHREIPQNLGSPTLPSQGCQAFNDAFEPGNMQASVDTHRRMECNSSASEACKDAQPVSPPIKKPYSIQVDHDGTIGGKDAAKFRSRCGVLIRSLVPISYKDWRLVDDVYLKNFWKALFQEFDMNVKPENAPEILSENLSQYYRTHKYSIRAKFIRTAATKQAAIAARPHGIDEVEWEMFVDNEWDEKKREQCLKNAANRGKNSITHGLGRKTYSDVYQQIKKGGGNPTRAAVWKVGHIGKDGNVLPSAQEKFNELVAAETRRKATPAHEHNSEMDFIDIENDEVVEVFGPDKKSRCRAISYNSSRKKVKFGQAVKEITEHKNILMSEKFQLRMEAITKATVEATVKDTVEATVRATVEYVVKECMKEFGTLLRTQLPRKEVPLNTVVEAPRTEGASNTDGNAPGTEGDSILDRDKICCRNLAINIDGVSNRTPTSRRQYVMLLSRDEKKVAKGYIANRNVCHRRKVARDERVVWVTEVMDPEAHIYEAPQDGNYKLCDIADGGFLIWLEGRLEYL